MRVKCEIRFSISEFEMLIVNLDELLVIKLNFPVRLKMLIVVSLLHYYYARLMLVISLFEMCEMFVVAKVAIMINHGLQ